MVSHRTSLILAVMLASPFVPRSHANEKPPALSGEDKKYLDGLMKEDFVFDPKGAERVAVKITIRGVWGGAAEVEVGGWYVPGQRDKPDRVYFIDGGSISVARDKAMKLKRVDFLADAKARYLPAKKPNDANPRDVLGKMQRIALGLLVDDDLVNAAWLHRLGHGDLAAHALATARRQTEDPRKRLREDLAWSAFAGMVHAFMVRADDEALAHGERLLRLYPGETKEKYAQANQIVEDLKRRQKKGTFGKTPAKWPDGFDKWDVKKKIAFLIEALEDMDARQDGQPGGVDLAADSRVEALIKLGDAAVPALIDTLDNDSRLMRSVHYWRDFARSRTVLSVREAALTALMSILRVRVFEVRSTGDNFTSRGDEGAKEAAKRLRAYWKEYGALPFDDRMMKVLTNPKETFKIKREAAVNLASSGGEVRLGTMVWTDSYKPRGDKKPNPVAAKFNKPTAAEAILAACDADLIKNANASDYEYRQIFEKYLWAVAKVGDKRIGQALCHRAGIAANDYERNQWKRTAYAADVESPLRTFANDFHGGKVVLSAGEAGERELRNSVASLIDLETPEGERALEALIDPKHRYHRMAVARVLSERVEWSDSNPWFNHPYCLRLLRSALDDTTPTGATYAIDKDKLSYKKKDGFIDMSVQLPAYLADPAARRDKATERACDIAAEKLHALVAGVPPYHPLVKNADQRLTALKSAFDRFAGNYRRANGRELEVLELHRWTRLFIPDVHPLGRAATAGDVKAGKAIFHLDGKSKAAGLSLPAMSVLRKDAKKDRPLRVIIVQAEVGGDGQVSYGVITKTEIRAVPAHELTGIKSFAELDKVKPR